MQPTIIILPAAVHIHILPSLAHGLPGQLPMIPHVELSATGLMDITDAHGRLEPNAIDLLLVGLIRFAQEQRFHCTLTLTMSPRDR